ncbi:MAG: hypothetical protein E6I73_04790 [Chloroflexi bacterium]|nr:MAG: hypothetical protein E6I73_04790 [Chloroflexota bacterium]
MRESDLRSLDRQRMYTIFSPLDANEQLPRELLMDARRHRVLGRRELAGVLWLPALVVAVFLAGVVNVSGVAFLAVAGALLLGFVVFAISGGRGRID